MKLKLIYTQTKRAYMIYDTSMVQHYVPDGNKRLFSFALVFTIQIHRREIIGVLYANVLVTDRIVVVDVLAVEKKAGRENVITVAAMVPFMNRLTLTFHHYRLYSTYHMQNTAYNTQHTAYGTTYLSYFVHIFYMYAITLRLYKPCCMLLLFWTTRGR